MALNLLTNDEGNVAIDAIFPTLTRGRTATATNTTTTLTFPDVAGIILGMAVTGAGISSGGLVTGVNRTTNVVTISGTITTLTTSAYVFTASYFGSLHTATPGQNAASEVSGGTYTRQGMTMAYPVTAGTELTSNAQNWTLMPAATVTYFGVSGASSGSTYYYGGGALGSSLTVPAGATVAAAIGALSLVMSA